MESIIILNINHEKYNHDNLQKTHYLNYFETILYDIHDKKIGSFIIFNEQLEVIDNTNKINKKIIYEYKGTNYENIKIYTELNENKSLNTLNNTTDLIHFTKNHEENSVNDKNNKKYKNIKNKKLIILHIYKYRKIIKKIAFIDHSCSFIYEYDNQNLLFSFSKKTHNYNNQIQSFFICTGGSSFAKTIFLSFGKHWIDYYLIRYIFQKISIKHKLFYLYKHQILFINKNSQKTKFFPKVEYYPHQINNTKYINNINSSLLSIYKINYKDDISYFNSNTLNNITHKFLKKETFIINNKPFEFMIDTFSGIIFEISNLLSCLSIKKKGNFLHIFPSNKIANERELSSLLIQNKETIYFYKDNHYILNETLAKSYFFVHNDWKSNCTLDEENIYKNNEKGKYHKVFDHTLIIEWEKWGKNIFHQYQGIYYSDELFNLIYIDYQFLLFLRSQNCIVNNDYQLQFQTYYLADKKDTTKKIILRNQNKKEAEYFIKKEIHNKKEIYFLHDSSLKYLPFTFLINNQLYLSYYYENQLFLNTQPYLHSGDTESTFDIHQPLGTLEFSFIDNNKIKINNGNLINYQIKLNINHKYSPLFFPNNISSNYHLTIQNIFIPVINQSHIYIIHDTHLSNKNEIFINDNEHDPYFISKFTKNNLCSILINEELSINYIEIQHSKTLFLYNDNNLIECIQYQEFPIYLEKNIYSSLISNNFDINYCLLEKELNSNISEQLFTCEKIFKEQTNNNSMNNSSKNIQKKYILYLNYINLFLRKKIQVYSKETFQKHYLYPKLEYFISSSSVDSSPSSIKQFSTIPHYKILQYPSSNNFNYQNLFLFIFDFNYLDDIIEDQSNIFYQYLQKISLFIEKQEQKLKQKQQNLSIFICTNYQPYTFYSKQCDSFIKNLSIYYSQPFYLTTTKSTSTICLLYDIKNLLQNFKIDNYESLFVIQSFLEEIVDNRDIKSKSIIEIEQYQYSQKNSYSYQISSLEEDSFFLLQNELFIPLSNYQIVLYIKNKYDFVYLILIWFLKHQHIWNKLENQNIIMNINLKNFLKIFSNEKKE